MLIFKSKESIGILFGIFAYLSFAILDTIQKTLIIHHSVFQLLLFKYFFVLILSLFESKRKYNYLFYKSKNINLPFTKENREIDLKNIELDTDATSLSEVTVRAEKSSLELKLDKRIFNVGKDLSNKGGTAEEILENIPSIDLDIEGNVSLRGSQSVRILVDGKPASMMGLDLSLIHI